MNLRIKSHFEYDSHCSFQRNVNGMINSSKKWIAKKPIISIFLFRTWILAAIKELFCSLDYRIPTVYLGRLVTEGEERLTRETRLERTRHLFRFLADERTTDLEEEWERSKIKDQGLLRVRVRRSFSCHSYQLSRTLALPQNSRVWESESSVPAVVAWRATGSPRDSPRSSGTAAIERNVITKQQLNS